MRQQLLKRFKNPSSPYRGKPFWAWNGKLEESELRRQIRIMRRMGFGGFFMHSRIGLETPYLSEEWFKLIAACADEARKQGMEAWLYDEDRWPSGAAGGLVTRSAKYRQKYLVMERINDLTSFRRAPDTLAVFKGNARGAKASGLVRLAKNQHIDSLKKGEVLLSFKVAQMPCSTWYNGFTYLDTLNPEAVKKFIEVTYEAYRKHTGEYFGKQIPGIFTDEPNYSGMFFSSSLSAKSCVPWTDKIPVVFKTRYGYDLRDHLPELFLDVAEYEVSQARYHYHDCITFLFVNAFARQIGQWCKKNNIYFTGHVLEEETLNSQTKVVGSCMRFYEYMQAPGMDLLSERRREYNTAKQVTSVAHQFGRKWRLTETYGCTGWDFPFAGHKALGDWQAALGINVRCPHLSWYTMEGQAKRDYPASISYQSPWWQLYQKVEDYFARIHLVMSQGAEVRDLLIIHPIESMWTMCRLGWDKDKKVQAYDRMLLQLCNLLLSAHIDFDYGDEDIISRHSRVRKQKEAAFLVVSKASYKAVLVPPLKTIRLSTLKILKEFQKAGGTVIFAGQPADYVDASASRAVKQFAKRCVRVPGIGKQLLEIAGKTCRRVSITDEDGKEIGTILYLLKQDKDSLYLFMCNTSHKASELKADLSDPRVENRKEAFPDVYIRLFTRFNGNPLELDPETGSVTTPEAVRMNDSWKLHTNFPPLKSRLFIVPKRKSKKMFPALQCYKTVNKKALARKRWQITLSEPNVLVLDRPGYRIGKAKWQSSDEILRVDRKVRSSLHLPLRNALMVQPWAQEHKARLRHIAVQLAYTINIEKIPELPLFLALEQPQLFSILINGNELPTDSECGWWVDKSLRKIPVDTVFLRPGRNEIKLTCEYDENYSGLEAIYLLGAFGVRVRGLEVSLTSMPASLKRGDWCAQGLPFYSGSVTYLTTIQRKLQKAERLFIVVPSYSGVAVRILVNGQTAGIIAWAPNEVDITDYLTKNVNEIGIEVISHRRNSHGPLHISEKLPLSVGPESFETSGAKWQDAYQLVRCGLMGSPLLLLKRRI